MQGASVQAKEGEISPFEAGMFLSLKDDFMHVLAFNALREA